MTDQSSGVLILEVILTAALIGVISAMIAQKKGRNFFVWWFFGRSAAGVGPRQAAVVGSGCCLDGCPHGPAGSAP
jgi:hypothetical protein